MNLAAFTSTFPRFNLKPRRSLCNRESCLTPDETDPRVCVRPPKTRQRSASRSNSQWVFSPAPLPSTPVDRSEGSAGSDFPFPSGCLNCSPSRRELPLPRSTSSQTNICLTESFQRSKALENLFWNLSAGDGLHHSPGRLPESDTLTAVLRLFRSTDPALSSGQVSKHSPDILLRIELRKKKKKLGRTFFIVLF